MNSKDTIVSLHIFITKELCNGCGSCVCVCTRKAIEMDKETGKVSIVNIQDCNACAVCISYCGEYALELVMGKND